MKIFKKIIIFVVVALVLVGGFLFLSSNKKESSSVVSLTGSESAGGVVSQDENVGGEFLNLLLSVKNIKLDKSIFSEKAFVNLRDSSILLVPEGNEGRVNPFAPLGQDSSLPVNNLSANPINALEGLEMNTNESTTSTSQINKALESLIKTNN